MLSNFTAVWLKNTPQTLLSPAGSTVAYYVTYSPLLGDGLLGKGLLLGDGLEDLPRGVALPGPCTPSLILILLHSFKTGIDSPGVTNIARFHWHFPHDSSPFREVVFEIALPTSKQATMVTTNQEHTPEI